jgi:hypothetical protein
MTESAKGLTKEQIDGWIAQWAPMLHPHDKYVLNQMRDLALRSLSVTAKITGAGPDGYGTIPSSLSPASAIGVTHASLFSDAAEVCDYLRDANEIEAKWIEKAVEVIQRYHALLAAAPQPVASAPDDSDVPLAFGNVAQDSVPLGTISSCPSCEGTGKRTDAHEHPCWRCSGSGRVMAYRETPKQFSDRMEKVKAFVDAVADRPEERPSKEKPCAIRR